MKILVLMGSPRKKDSYRACKIIENEMKKNNNVVFDYLYLNSLSIEDCKGCDLCFKKGEDYCPINDDLAKLKNQLLEADGIIFASPVYAYQVTGAFKRTIDRLSYLFHRPELIGKPALTLVTTGGGGQKDVTKYLNMTACGWGCNVIRNIEIISPLFFEENSTNKFYRQKYYDKSSKIIKSSAESLCKAIIGKDLPVPSYYQIYMFNGLRSKTYTSQADHVYWKNNGWLDSAYYYDVKMSPFKKFFGFTINQTIKYMWSKMQYQK